MAHHFLFESPLPPHDVLAALADYAKDWRESIMPAGLRRSGLLTLYLTVNGSDFQIHYGRSRRGQPIRFVCEGTVSPRPSGGGSLIRAHIRRDVTYLLGAAFGATLLFLWAIVSDWDRTSVVVTGLVTAAVTGSYLLQRYLPVTPQTPEGDEFRRLLRRAGEGHIPRPAPQS